MDTLWRRVVCIKSGADLNSLTLNLNRKSKRSTLFNLIGFFFDRKESMASIVNSKFIILVGNGSHTDFWTDNYTGRGELKEPFPRIFALMSI